MTKACEHAIAYVYQYLDEELTMARKSRIKWHLRKCDQCCGAFDFETRLKMMIREKGRDEPPPELFEHLRALIHEEDTGTPQE
jgi:mycothiol system anti-sigma-R factor